MGKFEPIELKKPLMCKVGIPKIILADYYSGNTRMVIAGDAIRPPEEQAKIKRRLEAIASKALYEQALRKQKEKEN